MSTPQLPGQFVTTDGEEERAPDRFLLPSGDIATLEMPDIYTIFSQIGQIPDPVLASVIVLLNTEGAIGSIEDRNMLLRMANQERGKFGIYKYCRKDKTLDLKRKRGDGNKILGRLDVHPLDLDFVYYTFFRQGIAVPLLEVPDDSDSGRDSGSSLAGENVSGEDAS